MAVGGEVGECSRSIFSSSAEKTSSTTPAIGSDGGGGGGHETMVLVRHRRRQATRAFLRESGVVVEVRLEQFDEGRNRICRSNRNLGSVVAGCHVCYGLRSLVAASRLDSIVFVSYDGDQPLDTALVTDGVATLELASQLTQSSSGGGSHSRDVFSVGVVANAVPNRQRRSASPPRGQTFVV